VTYQLVVFGALLLIGTLVTLIGWIEGVHEGYARAYADLEASHVAPMLLCPRCGPATEPFRQADHEREVATLGRHAHQRIGRLN
jgi:hypothetical protein